MPTAVLTNKANPASPTLSTTAATLPGLMQLIYNYFTSLVGSASCDWQVCSSALGATPYHVALKRKTGAPGRILFLGVTAAPLLVYNPQLSNGISWAAAGLRVAHFPEATSDVPGNMLATSGDVFTNPGNCTGLGANMVTYTGTAVLKLWSNEDGIIMKYGTPLAAPIGFYYVGDLGVDVTDTAFPVTGYTVSFADPFVATPTLTSPGAWAKVAGIDCHIGQVATYAFSTLNNFLRDNALKKTGYLPVFLGTKNSSMEKIFWGKLRQVGMGPTPLATEEVISLVDGGLPTPKAFGLNSLATTHLAWLTNFKF